MPYDLTRHFPVTMDQPVKYRQHGHCLLRGVVVEEIKHYRPLLERIIAKHEPMREVELAPDEEKPLLDYEE